MGSVAIVGAEGTTGREELRALLASEQARRMLAEKRLSDVTSESVLPLRSHDRHRWAENQADQCIRYQCVQAHTYVNT